MKDIVIDAIPSHIDPIATMIRQADMDECWSMGAITAHDALIISLSGADYARTWLVDDYPVAMGGIRREGGAGIIWLLGNETIEKYPRRFLVRAYAEFEKVKQHYDLLYNYIDINNVRYKAWLVWLGFHLFPPEPYGRFRHLFHRFEWRKNDSTNS